MSTFSILNETLFRCFLRWFIDNRHNGHEAGDAVTMPLHLGSTLATVFVALFSSSLGVFASFRSRPRMPVMNGSWRISRTEGNRRRRRKGGGGERKKDISAYARIIRRRRLVVLGGVKEETTTRRWVKRTGGGLPTTSSFSYDWSNQLYSNYGGSSLMISIDGSNLIYY